MKQRGVQLSHTKSSTQEFLKKKVKAKLNGDKSPGDKN
jgi:hypothetical protein